MLRSTDFSNAAHRKDTIKIMKEIFTYLTLGLAAGGYARFLNTDPGQTFADEFTWASVATGTGLVLLFLRFVLPASAWRKVATAFTVAGLPLIARSLVNRDRRLFLE